MPPRRGNSKKQSLRGPGNIVQVRLRFKNQLLGRRGMEKLDSRIDIVEEDLPEQEVLRCIWVQGADALGTESAENQSASIRILE